MDIQQRLLFFVQRANWILFFVLSALGTINFQLNTALGIIIGGLIVTINFHLLHRTLKKSLSPQKPASRNVVLVKYYVRFIISGFIIFILISNKLVDPIGLIMGLSIVVVSIILATMIELTKQIVKEAV